LFGFTQAGSEGTAMFRGDFVWLREFYPNTFQAMVVVLRENEKAREK
jgi:hypothetical protein